MNEHSTALPEPPRPPVGGTGPRGEAAAAVRSLARQDLSFARLAAWTAALVAATIGLVAFGTGFSGDGSGSAGYAVGGAVGLLMVAAGLWTMARLLRTGSRDKRLLRALVADPLSADGSYAAGGRGALWAVAGFAGAVLGLSLLAAAGDSSSSGPPVANWGSGVLWLLCGCGALAKAVGRRRLSRRAARRHETERLQRSDTRLTAESAAAGLELSAEGIAALHGPAGTRRRYALHRLSRPRPGVDDTEFYTHWNEWLTIVVALLVAVVGAIVYRGGLTHDELLSMGLRALIAVGVWLLLVLGYYLPFRVSYLRRRRAMAAGAEAGGGVGSRTVAVAATVDEVHGLLVEEAGALTLLTGTGPATSVPLARIRAVFQLVPPDSPWPVPGFDLLLDDGTWTEVRALDPDPVLAACERAGIRVLRAVKGRSVFHI